MMNVRLHAFQNIVVFTCAGERLASHGKEATTTTKKRIEKEVSIQMDTEIVLKSKQKGKSTHYRIFKQSP